MDPERFARLRELFDGATTLPAEERRAYLEAGADGDPALLAEAFDLLAWWEADPDSLTLDVRTAASRLLREGAGQRIGPYRVLRELGEGGMGVVYLAVRDDDVYRKRVAIKVSSSPGPGEEARFVTERQILATLEHPGIARLLDGGATSLGRPYLVMEYVEGEPIDLYCDRRALSTEARLELFRGVCHAVHYAHQNLVVHRDLKPSNILVTASGEAKLLDFGIAKLLAPDGVPGAPRTATGVRPMTPRYASPEQLRGEPVTTASDVYSLGVVLYELITGHHPFGHRRQALAGIERVRDDVEAARPSAVVVQDVDPEWASAPDKLTADELSRVRGTDPRRLRKRLRGDIDNVVLMAMNPAPSRRYASALQLSEDIRRHLQGEPVLARKPTWTYVAGKLIRRNRLPVAVAALSASVVVGFAVNRAKLASEVARERDLARRETETAQRVSMFLQDLFRASDPAKADTVTARELLDRAVEHARAELEDEPEAEAALFDTLGTVYGNLGLYDRAAPLLEDALRVRRATFGVESLEAAASLESLGNLMRDRAQYLEAEAALRESLRVRETRLHPDDPLVAASLHDLAVVRRYEGHYAEAEALYRRALAIRERRGTDPAGVAETLERLAQVLEDQGQRAGAESLARRAVDLDRRLGSTADAGLARALDRLGLILRDRGQLGEAEAATREALRLRHELMGPAHPNVGVSLAALASVLSDKGDLPAAEALDRQALDVLRRALGEGHADVAAVEYDLALTLERRANPSQAETLAQAAWEARRTALGEDNPLTLRAAELVWRIRAARGASALAEARLREILDRRRHLLPAGHPDIAESLQDLGALLARRGRTADAEPLLREAVTTLRSQLPRDHWRTARAEGLLGDCLLSRGRTAEAEPLLVEAESVFGKERGNATEAREVAQRLARLYEATGRAEKAAALRARLAG